MKFQKEQQEGYLLVFIGIGITVFLGMLSMAVNASFSRSVRTELQDAADSASHAAASILCSTNACYEDAMAIAISMLTDKTSSGIIKENIDFTETGNNFTWTNGEATITIHRGRWWPKDGSGYTNMPYSAPTQFFHNNGQFEDFDREILVDDSTLLTWQQAYPQLPDFLVSNAIYIKAELKYKNSFFNVFNISESTLTTEAYAVSGSADQEVCIAPFAIPACALLNNEGEYNKDRACLYERYFTQSNRYCTDTNVDGELQECGLVPGSLYRVFPKNALVTEDITEHTDYHMTEGSSVNFAYKVVKIFPPSVEVDYLDTRMKFTCDFKSSPNPDYPDPATIESPADFFGVVGMPLRGLNTLSRDTFNNGTYDPSAESSYQELFSDMTDNPSAFCLGARIGDNFKILKEGLKNVGTANAFRDVLLGNTNTEDYFDAKFNVIYHSLLTKNADYLPTDHPSGSPDLAQIHTNLECATTTTRHGICNSQLFHYDTQCPTSQNMSAYNPPNTQYFGNVLYSENMVPCVNGPTSTKDYIASNMPQQTLKNPGVFLTSNPNARTWTVAVPIIAAKGEGQGSGTCAGILSHPAPDPVLDQNASYTIVGFSNITFYDYDINADPPRRGHIAASIDPSDDLVYKARLDRWNSDHWDANEAPWGFQNFLPEEYPAPPYNIEVDNEDILNCNMVKAIQTCDQGLISAPENVTDQKRSVTIAVPY